MPNLPLSSERIDSQIARAERDGDVRLLEIAYLRRYVEEAEKSEGRTNRWFSIVLERLIDEPIPNG